MESIALFQVLSLHLTVLSLYRSPVARITTILMSNPQIGYRM